MAGSTLKGPTKGLAGVGSRPCCLVRRCMRADSMTIGGQYGYFWRSSAATPAMWGALMLVPAQVMPSGQCAGTGGGTEGSGRRWG